MVHGSSPGASPEDAGLRGREPCGQAISEAWPGSVLEGVVGIPRRLLLGSQELPVHLLQRVVHVVPVQMPVPLCPRAQEEGHVGCGADQQQEDQGQGQGQPGGPGEKGEFSCPQGGLSRPQTLLPWGDAAVASLGVAGTLVLTPARPLAAGPVPAKGTLFTAVGPCPAGVAAAASSDLTGNWPRPRRAQTWQSRLRPG